MLALAKNSNHQNLKLYLKDNNHSKQDLKIRFIRKHLDIDFKITILKF